MNTSGRKFQYKPHSHRHYEDMLSVEDARERILSFCERLQPRNTLLADALGLVLAEDLVADFDVPPAANSSMDGYAVYSADICNIEGKEGGKPERIVLPVSGMIAAGDPPEQTLKRGTAMRIMTGAPIPEGADAVVPFEDTDEHKRYNFSDNNTEIGITYSPVSGENVRPAGEDVERGQVVLKQGTVLSPSCLGVAASLGKMRVSTFGRPSVAVISTGDELMPPGESLRHGKIYDANSYGLSAAVKHYGGEPRMFDVVPDDLNRLEGTLSEAAALCDMVVTSAGVSKGDYDVVKEALRRKGSIELWSVSMRPAKPLAFGWLGAPDGRRVPHLGLPGNPVSAQVAFLQFGRPSIHKMMGIEPKPLPRIKAILDDPIENYDARRVYARVVVYRKGDVLRAALTGNQSSGALTSMAKANGLAICPEDVTVLKANEEAWVEIIDRSNDDIIPYSL